MNHRQLDTSDTEVSELGFGIWATGTNACRPVEDDPAIRATEQAVERGVKFIDTAKVNRNGHNETLIAQVSKGGLTGYRPEREAAYDCAEKVVFAPEVSLDQLAWRCVPMALEQVEQKAQVSTRPRLNGQDLPQLGTFAAGTRI